MLAVTSLDRRLPQKFPATRKGTEKLVIEVVPVSDDDNGRVLQGGLKDNLAREEDHGQALPRPLRMPDHAAPPVTVRPGSPDCAGDGVPDRVVLVVPGHLLRDRPVIIDLEDDVVPDQVEEPPLLKHPFCQYFEPEHGCRGELLPLDGTPRHEPLAD